MIDRIVLNIPHSSSGCFPVVAILALVGFGDRQSKLFLIMERGLFVPLGD